MSAVSPYSIRHVQLEELLDFYPEIKNNERYYCTFWWKHIPLGHLFLEEQEVEDPGAFQQKVLNAIHPCIAYYNTKSAAAQTNNPMPFWQQDFNGFSSVMESIFSNYRVISPPQKVDVSVIICTHNRSRELKRCLDSLRNQICQPQEIIVVDNAPKDTSTSLLVEQYKEMIYVKETRAGLSIARNRGLRLANAPIVAFADDDVTLHPFWTYEVWKTFLSPEIGAMTGLIIASSLETESQQIFERYWGFNKGYKDKIYDIEFIQGRLKKAPPVWEIGAGANMAFRKSLFDMVGYFDEQLGAGASGCSEDSEMWLRVLWNGFYIQYNPHAIVFHEHRKRMKDLRKQMFSYTKGHIVAAFIQHRKHPTLGYKKRIFNEYPVYYLRRLIKGFPSYRLKDKTLFYEILGWFSGILFFMRNHTSHPLTADSISAKNHPVTIN
jgi:glycosyltransferase involved in cell wall biosynthesis